MGALGGAAGSTGDAGGSGGRASASMSESSGTSGAGTGGTTNQGPVTWPLINGVQWADTDGNPIQAHGGGMLRVGQDYYWFGENRNANGSFYAVSAYRSRDVRRWAARERRVDDELRCRAESGQRGAPQGSLQRCHPKLRHVEE